MKQIAQVQSNLMGLGNNNGLWEALAKLSDYLLIDGSTAATLLPRSVKTAPITRHLPPKASATSAIQEQQATFGEQDVDSTLHTLFTTPRSGVFENMCNPPGGDWSGLVFQSIHGPVRWASLPRVTVKGSKRPDHVVTQTSGRMTLIVESKNSPQSVEPAIGPRLISYVKGLLNGRPNSLRIDTNSWSAFTGQTWNPPTLDYHSAAAFCYSIPSDLDLALRQGGVDLALGIEFPASEGQLTRLHIAGPKVASWAPLFQQMARRFRGNIEIQIH
ncbi:MAG: hypothetical protein ACYCOR_15540 [Acidobacteriaceae bacterium]